MTMIERVARAIHFNMTGDTERSCSICIDLAKVAIEAMKEPTEEMIDAGAYDLDMTVKTQYQNMIDAALMGE